MRNWFKFSFLSFPLPLGSNLSSQGIPGESEISFTVICCPHGPSLGSALAYFAPVFHSYYLCFHGGLWTLDITALSLPYPKSRPLWISSVFLSTPVSHGTSRALFCLFPPSSLRVIVPPEASPRALHLSPTPTIASFPWAFLQGFLFLPGLFLGKQGSGLLYSGVPTPDWAMDHLLGRGDAGPPFCLDFFSHFPSCCFSTQKRLLISSWAVRKTSS